MVWDLCSMDSSNITKEFSEKRKRKIPLGTKGRTSILSVESSASCGASFPVSRRKLPDRECFVTTFRQGGYPPCAACASIPCVLAVRKQHKMLFAASKLESEKVNVMKKKRFIIISGILVCLAIFISLAVWSNSPEQKAERFVKVNGLTFYDLVNSNQQIPTTLDGIKVDVWSGEHTMYEFLLGTGMGDTQYWGVYYSPDDVPLPYQNTDVSLIADDDGSWTWQTDGDNHGTTKKIIEKWYYFEASF